MRKAAKKKAKQSAAEFARSCVPRRSGRRSFMDKAGPDAVRDVETILRLRVKGESSASLADIHAYLVETHGYQGSLSALKQWVPAHLPELWSQVRGA